MRTANYTDFRKNLKTEMDRVLEDGDALVVERGYNKGVVLISLEEYNSIVETEYIMSNPQVVADIERSRKEFEEGKFVELDLEKLDV